MNNPITINKEGAKRDPETNHQNWREMRQKTKPYHQRRRKPIHQGWGLSMHHENCGDEGSKVMLNGTFLCKVNSVSTPSTRRNAVCEVTVLKPTNLLQTCTLKNTRAVLNGNGDVEREVTSWANNINEGPGIWNEIAFYFATLLGTAWNLSFPFCSFWYPTKTLSK